MCCPLVGFHLMLLILTRANVGGGGGRAGVGGGGGGETRRGGRERGGGRGRRGAFPVSAPITRPSINNLRNNCVPSTSTMPFDNKPFEFTINTTIYLHPKCRLSIPQFQGRKWTHHSSLPIYMSIASHPGLDCPGISEYSVRKVQKKKKRDLTKPSWNRWSATAAALVSFGLP